MGGEKPQVKTDDSFEKIFGAGGLVSQFHENYEYREGQIKMAEAIAPRIPGKETSDRRGRHRNG